MAQRRRSRKRRLNKRFVILMILLVLLISIPVGCMLHGQDTDSATQQTDSTPAATTTEPATVYGWTDIDGNRCYRLEDGTLAVGWMDLNGERYYFREDGILHTGWLEEGEDLYYFDNTGAMSTGEVTVAGENYHFTSNGKRILVVNPWNSIPDGYSPDLVDLDTSISVEGSRVDRSCYDALIAMLKDCNKECPQVCVVSSYRTHEQQTTSYNRKVQYYINQGCSEEDARKKAGAIIAVPGTSEHQLGLAVDIVDTRLWALEEEQADLPAQKWLMAHCWEYGFILRYPKDKTDSTGIIYEPWHYRYVGKDLAKTLFDSGMTLEEYMDSLS